MRPGAKTWILVVAAVAVIVAIVFYARSGPRSAAPSSVGVPVYAPQGELTPGFPKQLVLDSAAAVTNSYSIDYSSTTNQYTAAWDSSSSMSSLYYTYKAYLPANGWAIVNDTTKYPASRGLYAQNASSDVSVAIIAQTTGSQVFVSYLTK